MKTPYCSRGYRGLLKDMDAISGSWDKPDPVLIPENILQSLLGVSGHDLSFEAIRLAYENRRIAKLTPDGNWLFE